MILKPDKHMKQTISKLNKEWHLAHRMPKNPTLDQRIAWHIEHKRNCACRDIPEKIRKAITEQNNKTSNHENRKR
jgi:hypothetical protein